MNIITIGSALVDIFIQSPNFMIDEDSGVLTCDSENGKLEVETFEVKTGGGGSNTAVGFARLGFDVATVAELGKDEFAQLIIEDLRTNKVATDFVVQEHRERTGGSVILVAPTGQRTVLVHRGAASMLDAADIQESSLRGRDWIHLSSISGQLPALQKIAELAQASHTKLSWNPGKKEIKLIVAGALDVTACEILLVNQEEWDLLAAKHDALLRQVSQIVITNSDKGGRVILNGKEEHTYQAQVVTAIDATGAGDAFVVGYIASHLQNPGNWQQACQWGSQNAAAVVQQVGAKAGLLSKLG